jgi:hypothetical protein
MIVVIFYMLIYIEISKKSGILAIVDDVPPSWIIREGVSTQKPLCSEKTCTRTEILRVMSRSLE